MGRPAIDHWFDSTIQIWRPLVTKDALMVEHRSYVAINEPVGARQNRSATSTAHVDAGMGTVGSLRWYGRPDIDVQRRDICEVLTGPDSDRLWEVNGDPVHPANHHTQVDCTEWHGQLVHEVDS